MEHGCMVYTELAPRRQQFHVAPAMPALEVHHFGGYSKKTRYTKPVTHVEPDASAVSLLKRAENKRPSIKRESEGWTARSYPEDRGGRGAQPEQQQC